MTRLHHQTALDRDCERIVRPITDDSLAGYRDGRRGYSAKKNASSWYLRGYSKGLLSRYNQWLVTFGV